jgi:hypothetical protein
VAAEAEVAEDMEAVAVEDMEAEAVVAKEARTVAAVGAAADAGNKPAPFHSQTATGFIEAGAAVPST